MRRLAHAFLAAGDDDAGRPELDLLGAERHGTQARTAELVHAPGRRIDGNAGIDRGLARRVLPGAGAENLPHDHFGYLAGLHPSAFHGSLDGNLAQFVGRQAGQRAVEGADGGAGSARDHDGGLAVCRHR